MAGKKCLFRREEDEEEDFITSRCFQVGADVKLKETPTTGEEYLLKVMKERENYASIAVCDYKKLGRKLNKKAIPCYDEVQKPVAADTIKPTIEWQNVQVADFSEVRMYIQSMIVKELLPEAIKNLDLAKNRAMNWQTLFDEEEPTMTHVVGLNQAIIDIGLVLLTSRLKSVKPGESIDRKTGQWIYTLLAVTRYPQSGDTTAELRALARQCLDIRSKINPEAENAKELATPLNLFICLIARYFEQKDLAD